MSLESKTKQILNDFAKTQVALNDRDKPAGESGIQLGSLLDEAHGALRSVKAIYEPASDGGTSGETYTLDMIVPEGAILTRSWIATNSAGTGAATLEFKLGANDLVAVPIAVTAATLEALDHNAALPSDTALTVDVAAAAATDGQFMIVVEYIYPVK